TAIAKARGWIDDIRLGRLASLAEIAEREAVGERHIRFIGTPRLSVTPHYCRDRRWHGGSDRHRPCQSLALFVGRAGPEDRAPFQVATLFYGRAVCSVAFDGMQGLAAPLPRPHALPPRASQSSS